MNHLEDAKRVDQSSEPDQFPDPGASLLGGGGWGGFTKPTHGSWPTSTESRAPHTRPRQQKGEKVEDKAAGKIQGLSHGVLCGSELGAAPQALP